MKIVFLFDQVDNEGKVVAAEAVPFVTTPDKLNLRQLAPGLSSLGVVFEQADEKGEKQLVFRQIINFPINLLEAFPNVEAEIEYLKKLLAQKIGELAVSVETAKAQAAIPVAPAATPAVEETTISKTVVKKAKKSGK